MFFVKFQSFFRLLPELEILFGMSHIKRAQHIIKIFADLGLVEFYLYCLVVGICHEEDLFLLFSHQLEKINNMGVHLNEMPDLFFGGLDVQGPASRPEDTAEGRPA